MRKTPLDQWISQKIHGRAGSELTQESVRRYQLEKLKTLTDYVLEKSPFYRERLQEISSRDLQCVNDISALPMTTADDLRRSGPRLLCISQSHVDRVVTLPSPGEDEAPRRIYFSADDLELTIDFFHHGMSAIAHPGQRVLILMPGDRPGTVGDLLAKALARAGAQGFVRGIVTDPAKTISDIVDKEIDCIVGIPTQVLSVARSDKANRIPEGRISSVLLSSDYAPSSVINELQRVWACKVFCHYGTTEMGLGGGVECEAFDGYHLREADLLFEVVDPVSGRSLPDGQLGEIVFTTLTRNAMPLIRYRTGDLSRFVPEPCPCGTALRRLAKVKGKTHDGVPLRSGAWLRIADLDETLFAVPGIANYQASLTRSNCVDRLELIMYSGSCGHQPQLDEILGAVNSVPAIAHAVEKGDLMVEPIRFSTENWGTTGAAKRVILQRSLKE
jgi:phenylacetate-CoA ligase